MTKTFFYTTLFVVFALSVLVRLPNLNRPLFKHHEFATATTLVFNEIWQQRGFWAVKGAPCSTYEGEGNRFCENLGIFTTENGNSYYLSHAPLAFYFTYAIAQITGDLTVLKVQIFNLLLHLLTLFWVGKIIIFVLPTKRFALVAGLFLYGFAPILLWCHGNCYVHEAVVFPFYYAVLYAFLEILYGNKKLIWWFVLIINLWLGIYTDWLCAMQAAVLGVFALAYRGRAGLPLFGVCASGAFVVAFTVWQFGQLDTVAHFVAYFQQRAAQRAGIGNEAENLSFLQLLMGWTKHHFLGFGSIFIVIFGSFLFLKIKKIPLAQTSDAFRFILFATATTAFLYESLTLEFCATHDYSVMKSFFPLLLCAVFFMIQIPQKNLKIVLLFVITALNVAQYYYINRVGNYNQNGDRYDAMQRIGTEVRTHSRPKDLVLLSGFEMNAQLLYYAKHNLETISDSTEIPKILAKHKVKQAIWVQIVAQKVMRVDTVVSQSVSQFPPYHTSQNTFVRKATDRVLYRQKVRQ